MTELEVKKRITRIVRKNLNSYDDFQIYLFGLYNNENKSFSDGLDVAIDAGSMLTLNLLDKIENELYYIPSRKKIYLFDLNRINNKIRNIALKTGELIN
jgi:hypothetical protein